MILTQEFIAVPKDGEKTKILDQEFAVKMNCNPIKLKIRFEFEGRIVGSEILIDKIKSINGVGSVDGRDRYL
jgi:hypothetical protein